MDIRTNTVYLLHGRQCTYEQWRAREFSTAEWCVNRWKIFHPNPRTVWVLSNKLVFLPNSWIDWNLFYTCLVYVVFLNQCGDTIVPPPSSARGRVCVWNVSFTDYRDEEEAYASEETVLSYQTAAKRARPPRLDALETFFVICSLEKWIDRISVLDAIDNAKYDNAVVPQQFDSQGRTTRTAKKLREYVSRTLAQTVRELRSSNTFTVLQRTNDSMLKMASDEQQLERELLSNQTALIDLRTKKKRYKQLYLVNIYIYT